MVVPATAEAGPPLLIWTSAAGVRGTEVVALLFVASPSMTPGGTATVTVFTSAPVAPAAMVAPTVKVAVSPACSVTVVAMLPVPAAAAHDDPAAAAQVQLGATSIAGNRSVTVTPATVLGPWFVTTIE